MVQLETKTTAGVGCVDEASPFLPRDTSSTKWPTATSFTAWNYVTTTDGSEAALEALGKQRCGEFAKCVGFQAKYYAGGQPILHVFMTSLSDWDSRPSSWPT